MSYIALYREWRPAVFEDVVEQEHVVKTLRHSVSAGRIGHAYLFCGTRGTGKTTMAHILSRAINCLNPNNGDPCNKCEICREILSGSSTDVLEIDAASNNSVDNVREIRDEVVYAPSRAKYKVYIIDEVHMLSTGAFNALLKTLEEPPAHVVFILATTEPHKLPATVLSRCQRFDFRRITVESIVGRLEQIASAKGVKLGSNAARLMARMSEGAMRDAISLLDQCMSLGNTEISYDDVLSVVGIVNDTFMGSMVDDMVGRNIPGLLDKVNTLVMDGRDIPHFISDLVLYYRNLLICTVAQHPAELTDAPAEVLDVMKRQSALMSQGMIINTIKELSLLESSMKWATSPRVLLEVTLVRLCEKSLDSSNDVILERLKALEDRINSGNFSIAEDPNPSAAQTVFATQADPAAKTVFATQADPAAQTVFATKTVSAAKAEAGSSIQQFDKWQDIMDYLKSLGRRTLHSLLLESKVILMEGNTLGIIIESSFVKTSVTKPENLAVLENAAEKVLGFKPRITCVDPDIVGIISKKAKELERDELVEKAKSLADRADVPFDIIDG
jgi:DNA polymerase-3 subunit gamma/tau